MDQHQTTALHRAATAGHETTVRLLLKRGADVAAKDCAGYTVLNHRVMSKLSSSAIRLLIENRVDVDAKSSDREVVEVMRALVE